MTSTTTPRRGLYMIAIVPPDGLAEEIREIQEHVAREYRSREALRRPVHITLVAPFESPRDSEPALIDFCRKFSAPQKPFDVLVDGFGEFHRNTIFVKPVESPEIMQMQKLLSKEFAKMHLRVSSGPNYGFHPHITIGFKDFTREMFEAAWREFEPKIFRRRFVIDRLSLMRHEGSWKTIAAPEFMGRAVGSEEPTLFG